LANRYRTGNTHSERIDAERARSSYESVLVHSGPWVEGWKLVPVVAIDSE
jgi:hypothetical protein